MAIKRALVLATRGLLGSVLARVTRGLLLHSVIVDIQPAQHRHTSAQISLSVQPIPLAVQDSQYRQTSDQVALTPPPVVAPAIPVITATGGGTSYGTHPWFEDIELLAYRFAGFGVLVLRSETRFYHTEKLQPVPFYDYYDVEVPLYLSSESEWSLWDQADDDEEVEPLLMAYLRTKDQPYRWNEPYQ